MAGSFATIQTAAHEGVFTITLNRPEVLNAFNVDMSVELGAALRLAQREDSIRCLILTGAGRAFCAGQDLRALRASAGEQSIADNFGLYLRETLNPIVLRLRTMEKPVVAAVNGVAAGAGVSLALACDLCICAASASFNLAFVQVGLIPDGAATLTLVQRLGYARAAELCLLAEPVSAQQALQMGLVNRVVDDHALPKTAFELASRLATLPARAIALTKRALSHAWTATLDEQLEYEAHLQTTAGRTADHREGVAAFLEKRPPHFTGT